MDWDVATYGGFSDLRLRPALDLLGRVPLRPARLAVDLGCGSGAAAEALAAVRPGATLIGVDPSPAMLEKAAAAGRYAAVEQDDAHGFAARASAGPVDLLFSNAALHWAGAHETLLPALLERVAPGGFFAVQMPRQFGEPSHRLLQEVAAALHPDRFDAAPAPPPVAEPAFYRDLLAPLCADLDLWETVYHQRLAPAADGLHPVASFTRSTAARPFLERLTEPERAAYLAAYSEALAAAYTLQPDGAAWTPFRRLFFVATR